MGSWHNPPVDLDDVERRLVDAVRKVELPPEEPLAKWLANGRCPRPSILSRLACSARRPSNVMRGSFVEALMCPPWMWLWRD